jgi:hypothetical protein
MFKTIVFAALLALTSFAALAAQPYVDIEKRLSAEQLHSTGLDTLTPEQLAALNLVLRGDADAVAKAAVKDAPKPLEGDPGRGMAIGLDESPIKTQILGTVTGWEPGTEFKFANGQTWKVLKGSMKLRKPMESPKVELVPGMMGRWFLHVDEDLPGARVYRID